MFFRRKKSNHPSPPWIKWLVYGFVVVAILSNLHKTPANSPVLGALQKAQTDIAKTVNVSDYKRALFPDYNAELSMNDTKAGSGNPAVCGQEATIAYASFLTNNQPIGDSATKDKPLIFTIGEGKVLPALEQGVVGMQPGGTRTLIAPSSMAYGASGHARDDVPVDVPVHIEVELLSAQPPLPDLKATPYRISDTVSSQGTAIRCGEVVRVDVTVWSIDGKKLFSTADKDGHPLTFTPGKSEVFLGLEQGVLGMGKGGMRTLIVSPPFQKTLTGSKPAIDFPFTKNQTVLVDVVALP